MAARTDFQKVFTETIMMNEKKVSEILLSNLNYFLIRGLMQKMLSKSTTLKK